MTESEYQKAQEMSLEFKDSSAGEEARHIVATLFADASTRGSQRLREHDALPINASIDEFLVVLHELFNPGFYGA